MTEATLPDPLVPAEVDLRDFAFMPLDVVRLRDSDLAALEPPEACWAAVLLWCASWHQVPAASIPDDDRVLANLAGFGRVVKEWQKLRDGALRGWVKCSDGRLYHPVVAEKALDAWRSKLEQRWRTECGRIKKHNQRHGMSLPIPEFESWLSIGCPQGHALPVPEDTDPSSPGTGQGRPSIVPRETPSKGQGEGQGQGQGQGQGLIKDKDKQPAVAPARPAAEQPQLTLVETPAAKPKEPPDCPHLEVLALWAEVLPAMPQHKPSQWKGSRADHLRTRWRETAVEEGWTEKAHGLTYLRRLFAYVGRSPFLTGRVKPRDSKPPFVIELEWLVLPSNWAKVIEGKYHEASA
jgi:uncharacterized protein DUF1376